MIDEPFAVSIKQVAASEGCCPASVYVRLAKGEYRAVKDGKRTLVLWESVKARRATLKPAKFKAPSLQSAQASTA
jgi:hypothetical protein